jgi:hypothetical protein
LTLTLTGTSDGFFHVANMDGHDTPAVYLYLLDLLVVGPQGAIDVLLLIVRTIVRLTVSSRRAQKWEPLRLYCVSMHSIRIAAFDGGQ